MNLTVMNDAEVSADQSGLSRGETCPGVSVIIPVHNDAETLARAIASALAQDFAGGVEVIVVNNGSTDGTAEVIAGYGDSIVAINETTPGVSAARNAGIRVARGEYIAFLDADDVWLPEKLARTVPLLENDPECVLAYHDAIEVDNDGRVLKTSYYPLGHDSPPTLDDLLSGIWLGLPIPTCTVLMRREVVIRIGGFDEKLPAAEDLLMFIRAREQGPFRYLPEPLARRQWEPSRAREEWYIAGGYALYDVIRSDYGKPVATSNLVALLIWLGKLAHLRGERVLAARRYLGAIRLKPTRAKSWLRLFTTFMPIPLVAHLERQRLLRLYGPSYLSVAVATSARNG